LQRPFSSLEEIEEAGLILGAQNGSIQYEMAMNLTDAANVKQYGTLDVGLAALNEGDIDGMIVSTSSAEPMLATFPNLMILPQDNFDLDPERLYSTNVIAFPLGEEYASLIELANKVINENIENGNLEQWQQEAVELSRDAIEE
jgi:Bacterial extracellular solute-binding proteins, family 3.